MASRNRELRFEATVALNPQAAAQLEKEIAALTKKANDRRFTQDNRDKYQLELNAALAKYADLRRATDSLERRANTNNRTAAAALKAQAEATRSLTRAQEALNTTRDRAARHASTAMSSQWATKIALEQQRQAAHAAAGIAGILKQTTSLTQEQLDRVEKIWGAHVGNVKKYDNDLYQTVQGGINKFKAQLKQRAQAAQGAATLEKMIADRKRAAAKESDNQLKTLLEKSIVDLKAQFRKEEAERKRNAKEVASINKMKQQNARKGEIPLDIGVTRRGLISGIAGLGGANLYGLGILGAAASGIKYAVEQYMKVFQTKTTLAGIVQTFGQFKDEQGRNLEPGQNFEKSQEYSQYLYQRLRKTAVKSPLTLSELSDVYTTGVPFLARSGVSFEKSIGIANTVASMGKAMGLRMDSIKDDIRAIYEGRFRNVQTFQAAGFSKDDFKKLSTLRGDDLANFFDKKFSGFQMGLKKFAGSFEAQWTAMIDSLQQSAAVVGEKIAPVLIGFATQMQEMFARWTADGTLDKFAADLNTTLSALATGLTGAVAIITTFGASIVRAVSSIFGDAASAANKGATDVKGASLVTIIQNAISSDEEKLGAMGTLMKFFNGTTNGKKATAAGKASAMESILDNPAIVSSFTQARGQMQGATETYKLAMEAEQLGATLFPVGRGSTGAPSEEYLRDKYSGNPLFYRWLEIREKLKDRTGISFGSGGLQIPIQDIKGEAKANFDAAVANLPGSIGDYSGIGAVLEDLKAVGLSEKEINKAFYGNKMLPGGKQGPVKPQVTVRRFLEEQLEMYKKEGAPSMTNIAGPPDVKKPKSGTPAAQRITQNTVAAQNVVNNLNTEIERTSYRMSNNPMKSEGDFAAYEAQAKQLFDLQTKRNAAQRTLDQQTNTVQFSGAGTPSREEFQNNLKQFVAASGGKIKLGPLSRSLKTQWDLWNSKVAYWKSKGYSQAEAEAKTRHTVGDPRRGMDGSWHLKGLANDLRDAHGHSLSIKGGASPEDIAWAHQNASKFGLEFPMSWESWHIQPKGLSHKQNVVTGAGNKLAKAQGKTDLNDERAQGELDAATKRVADARVEAMKKRAKYQNDMADALGALAEKTDSLSPEDIKAQAMRALNIEYSDVLNSPLELNVLDPEFYKYLKRAKDIDLAYKKNKAEFAKNQNATDTEIARGARMARYKIATDQQSLKGLYGGDLMSAMLDQQINQAQEDYQAGRIRNGVGGNDLLKLIETLQDQKRSLEENTEALNKQLDYRYNKAVKGIFEPPETMNMSPSQHYRYSFDKKIEAIDRMGPKELRQVRASMGLAGIGFTDDQLRSMLKIQATKGYSRGGMINNLNRDSLFNGANAFLGAIQSGANPIDAFAGQIQDIAGDESRNNLMQALFSHGGNYQKLKFAGMAGRFPQFKKSFDKGAFTKDLIGGGGGFISNYLVGQLGSNNYSQVGGQLGGLAASFGAFAGLGAWAGPVGILAGGLIGSLFGKGHKQEDPAIEQHRKRLEELLQSINNRLKPQEDFYRTIKGDALFGSASRWFGGRASSLGMRAGLGVF